MPFEEQVISIDVHGLDAPLRFERSPHEGFWQLFKEGEWEPETLALLTTLLCPGKRFVDIGAWIGPTAIVAAARGSEVLAFEPDPVARGYLERNVRLNGGLAERIKIFPFALGRTDGSARLSSATLGDSMSSLKRRSGKSVEVETLDVRKWATTSEFVSADLVKIDVEGSEYSIIPAMSPAFRRHRPTLLLSVHGYTIRDRFIDMPKVAAQICSRVVSVVSRIRLVFALRSFEFRYEYNASAGKWSPLHGRMTLRFMMQMRNTELILSRGDLSKTLKVG